MNGMWKGIITGIVTTVFLLRGGALLLAQEGPAAAVVREVTGTVEVKPPGASWIPAAPGQRLETAAMISTGFKSTALITIGNSTLTVRPLTRLSLEELSGSQGDEKVKLQLRAGRIRAEVTPPPGGKVEFNVRSPTATASVRGTVFDFDGIRLQVEEGRVHLAGGDQSGIYVSAGHQVSTDIVTGKTASAAEEVREALVPVLPAGMESAPDLGALTPAAIPPAPTPPAPTPPGPIPPGPTPPDPPGPGDLDVGVEWK
jgi:hypothetical protein